MGVRVVRSGSPGAPALNGLAGSLLAVLDFALIIGRVFTYDGSSFTDVTAEARSAGGTPFPLFPGPSTSDICYFGYSGTVYSPSAGTFVPAFNELTFDLSQTGSGGSYVWEYWNGSSWASLTVQDATNGFTQSGKVSWTPPSDWATTTVNGHTTYWVRVRPTSVPSTNPECLSVTAGGWIRSHEGTNKAAYMQGPWAGAVSRPRYHLRVLDDGSASDAREASWIGYETMSDVDTGTNRFPSATQASAGLAVRKSNTADSTVRSWVVVADHRTFVLFIHRPGFSFGPSPAWCGPYIFGDYVPVDPNYQYPCMIRAKPSFSTESQEPGLVYSNRDSATPFEYLARDYAGTAISAGARGYSSALAGTYSAGAPYSCPGNTHSSVRAYLSGTNLADGRVWVAPVWVTEHSNFTVIGQLRGLWVPLHLRNAFSDGAVHAGAGGQSGRALEFITPVRGLDSSDAALQAGAWYIEVTDTWDE